MAPMLQKPYFLEKTLLARVQEYMTKHENINYDNINYDYATDYLIENFPEFKMKKKKFFKKSVIKAFNWEKQQRNTMNKVNENSSRIQNESSTGDQSNSAISTPSNSTQSNGIGKRKTTSVDSSSIQRQTKKRKMDDVIDITLSDKKKSRYETSIPEITLEDVFGIEPIVEKIVALYQNFHPCMMDQTSPSKSVLIMGPKGAGKSHLTNAIAGHYKIPLMKVSIEDLLPENPGPRSGADLLEQTFKEALSQCPCILHFTDLHVLSSNAVGSSKFTEKRLIRSLESNIAALNDEMKNEQILVVGEFRYNPTQSIESVLRSCFNEELFIPALNKKDRLSYLKTLISTLTLSVDLEEVAKSIPSFLPGDILTLVKNAKQMAVQRHHKKFKENASAVDYVNMCRNNFNQRFELNITEEDFGHAIKNVIPVLKQDGFPTVPEVSMTDIGGMDDLKQKMYDSFLLSIEKPELAKAYSKVVQTSGILLWGPPGCGKTLFAKAVANQAGINFLLISGAEVLKMYQGESERTIREAFALAKSVSPCVIYFDEFEGICPTRSGGADSGSKGTIVTTLLSELNGVQSREGVYVMASTNRPDVIDPALLRPGRFDTKLYVGLPDQEARKAIFMAESNNGTLPRFDAAVELDSLSEKCKNFSGADCSQLIKVASLNALKKYDPSGTREIGTLYVDDFQEALDTVKPSVSAQALKDYENLKSTYLQDRE